MRCPLAETRWMRRLGMIVLPLALCLVAAGCATQLEGPQLTEPPPGLAYAANARAEGERVFGLETRLSRHWERIYQPRAWASVTELKGRLSSADVEDARRELERVKPGSPEDAALPALIRLEIDGCTAFAWPTEGGSSRRFTAIILADDATFIVSVSSQDPAFSEERQLRRAVTSFRRDPFRVADVLVPVASVLIAGAAALAWSRRRSAAGSGERSSRDARPF
jgi:hypothetical protein